MTLIDALDTLAVMGNNTEFRRVSYLLIEKAESFFDMDINVSVFETNIRGKFNNINKCTCIQHTVTSLGYVLSTDPLTWQTYRYMLHIKLFDNNTNNKR